MRGERLTDYLRAGNRFAVSARASVANNGVLTLVTAPSAPLKWRVYWLKITAATGAAFQYEGIVDIYGFGQLAAGTTLIENLWPHFYYPSVTGEPFAVKNISGVAVVCSAACIYDYSD